MRFTPAITTNVQDGAVRQLLEYVFRLLKVVPEYNIYKSTQVWHVPFNLQVNTNANTTRIVSPDVVRVGRALLTGDLQTPVYTGSVLWLWRGNGQVQILDVAGLVDGVSYDLTFEVVG
jgi:hypothetical protein